MKKLFLTTFLLLALPAAALASVTIGQGNTTSLTSGLVGYWTLDGSKTNWATGKTTDSSGNANTGQLVSMSTTTSPIVGKVGQAMKFDGSSSYIPTTDGASLQFGTTGNFTIVAWIKPASTLRQRIVNKFDNTSGIGIIFDINENSTGSSNTVGNLRLRIDDGTNTGNVAVAAGVAANVWQEIIVTVNRTAGTATFYRNGVQVSTAQSISTVTGSVNTTEKLSVGSIPSVLGTYFNGSMDDVRVYNRVLSAQEIRQLYSLGTANVAHSNTVSLTSGLVGYWTLDGSKTNWATGKTTDSSGNGNTGQLVSMSTTTSPAVGKIGQALRFNGANRIDSGDSFYSDTLTVCAWVRQESTAANGIVVKRNDSTNTAVVGLNEWMFVVDGSGHILWAAYDSDGTAIANLPSLTVLSTNTWYHVCATHSGNGGSAIIYVNGKADRSPQAIVGTIADTASIIQIGTRISNNNTYFMDGSIDDVRVYNRALSAQEVAQLYAQGAGTIAHTNTIALSSGLLGYWSMDGNTINWATGQTTDSSGNGNTGQLISMSTTTSPAVGKIGQGLKFDGTASKILTTSNSTLTGNPSFTVSAWAYIPNPITQVSTYPPIVWWGASANNLSAYFGIESTNPASFFVGFHGSGQCGITINNKWVHYVWTRTGGGDSQTGNTLYVNGASVSLSNCLGAGTTPNISASPYSIGSGNSRFANYKVDDVRVYNRALSAQEVSQLYLVGK